MKKRLIALTSAALALSILLTACSGGSSSSASSAAASSAAPAASAAAGGTDTSKYLICSVNAADNPDTVDVQMTSAYYGIPLNIYDRLVESASVNGETKIVPGLADSWDISKDGLTYTFKLHKGVKFSNGEELKADDVVYTVNRMMDPATKAQNTDVYDLIVGADDVLNGKAKTVSGVKAVDDYTVEMKLAKPFAPFLANLTVPGASIYNRKFTTAAGTKFGSDAEHTCGTGAFTLKQWTVNSEIVMANNPNYFKGASKLAGVDWKIVPDSNTAKMMFENGQIDLFDTNEAKNLIPYFKQSAKWKNNVVSGPIAGVYYFMFNENVKPLDNPKVRKAIEMAIDRKTILDQLYYGEGTVANTIIPSDIMGYNKDAAEIKYDPTAAKQLLTEAGYPNGFSMEIFQMNTEQVMLQANQVIQSELAQLGIKVKITQLDSATYLAKRKDGVLMSYQNNWSADYNDPDNFIYTFFSSKNTKARSVNYTNTAVMKQVEDARLMTDTTARMELYHQIEKTIVQDDAAFFPLYQLNRVYVVSNRVKDFKLPWNGWSDMSYYNVTLQ